MDNKTFFGLRPSPSPIRDFEYNICCGATQTEKIELPSRFELPVDKWMAVRKQEENSCVSYALSSAQEAHHYKTTGESVRWSPGYIYGNEACRPSYDGEGMYLADALKGVTEIAFVKESVFDIITEMPEMKAIMSQRSDLLPIGEPLKLKGFVSLNYALKSKKIQSMKEALYTMQIPLVVSSDDYFGGAHCFLIYGWDDNLDMPKRYKGEIAFLLRNSWGEEYEDGGNYYIPTSKIDQVYLPLFEELKFPFEDVSSNDWYYNEVRKAVFSGLVQGVTKTTFAPNETIIRGDVAVIIERLLIKLKTSIDAFIRTLQQKGVEASSIQLASIKSVPFKDVLETDYYYNAISTIWSNNLIEGVSEETFEPLRAMSRAELATVMVRTYTYILQLITTAIPSVNVTIDSSSPISFTDVSQTDWFYEYVEKACQLGLAQGYENEFRPNDTCTRAEAVTMFNRLFKYIDKVLESTRA